MSLLDILTGGENQNAKDALNRASAAFSGIPLPTAQQLTLPELQKYVQAGILTPAEAQTMLQQGNAFNDIKVDPSSMEAEMSALNQLKDVAEKGGMTDQMKAQLTQALDTVNTNTRGNNAAILDQAAQRGVPTSLMGTAAMLNEGADQARNANLTATQAAGQAEQNAINAMMSEGNLASSMHGQQYTEAANKAAAENAMREWNAGATNSTNEANAQRAQQANGYNAGVKQDVSNQNTQTTNERTQYNAGIPQQQFNNAVTKAGGTAGVNKSQADQSTAAGNQMMGLYGSLIGAGSNALAYDEGGLVPGDSPSNDVIPARLSPGEAVIPRSVMHSPDAPDMAKSFVQHLLKARKPVSAPHPDDVHAVLEALSRRREPTLVGAARG